MITTEERKEQVKELTEGLAQCIGTDYHHKHQMTGFKYTDGVLYLAEKAKAHWLVDAIFSYMRKEPFQVWELEVTEGKSHRRAELTMREDTNRPLKVHQRIGLTDFPLDNVKLWLINGVLILPSEY